MCWTIKCNPFYHQDSIFPLLRGGREKTVERDRLRNRSPVKQTTFSFNHPLKLMKFSSFPHKYHIHKSIASYCFSYVVVTCALVNVLRTVGISVYTEVHYKGTTEILCILVNHWHKLFLDMWIHPLNESSNAIPFYSLFLTRKNISAINTMLTSISVPLKIMKVIMDIWLIQKCM